VIRWIDGGQRWNQQAESDVIRWIDASTR